MHLAGTDPCTAVGTGGPLSRARRECEEAELESWLSCLWVTRLLQTFSAVKMIRKEMFYLTMHSTHFIYGYMANALTTELHLASVKKINTELEFWLFCLWVTRLLQMFSAVKKINIELKFRLFCLWVTRLLQMFSAVKKINTELEFWLFCLWVTVTRLLQTFSAVKKIRKEMFYLTMHSTHFIYGYMANALTTELHLAPVKKINTELEFWLFCLWVTRLLQMFSAVKKTNTELEFWLFCLWVTVTRLLQTFSAVKKIRKEMFHLTMHSTHFIYGYMASDIW